MIFENEPKPVIQEAIARENTSLVSQIISFGADKSFILNSLQRMKTSTECEIKKKRIDDFISEYLINFSEFVENQGFDTFSEDYRICPIYAKQSYEKVLREQEYLSKIMTGLSFESI